MRKLGEGNRNFYLIRRSLFSKLFGCRGLPSVVRICPAVGGTRQVRKFVRASGLRGFIKANNSIERQT